jgi:putative hydrolase of the HAD superfamily
MLRVVFGSYDADTDHVWHQLERGEISFVDALTEIKADAEAAGFRFDSGEMFSMMVTDQIDRSLVVEAVRLVRAKGLRTAIVTNNIREYGDAWRNQFPLDELFDAVVDSSEEGVRKPDPAIFLTALERVGVDDPARAIFLDDFPGNVAAAEAMGMHGILVGEDPTPALDELMSLID